MVDGEALLIMMAMILSKIPHPGRMPERSFWFRIAVSGGGGATELFLEKRRTPPRFLVQEETYR